MDDESGESMELMDEVPLKELGDLCHIAPCPTLYNVKYLDTSAFFSFHCYLPFLQILSTFFFFRTD